MSDHGDRLLREMRQTRGHDSFHPQAPAKDEGLPIKYRELVALGIPAFRGVAEDALINHIRRAFQHGATRAEVLGALEATAVPGGAVTFIHGLRALTKVEHEGT